MVNMYVGINQETNRRGTDLSDRRQDFVRELPVLGIDHEDTVRPGQHADPSAGCVLMTRVETCGAGQHV